MISEFRGKYYFLSNFYSAPILFDGREYSNNEAAFQSMKTEDLKLRDLFGKLDPSSAKRKGRNVKLRSNWEQIKDTIMYHIVTAKFTQNLDLRKKLLATGEEVLVEGNNWGDNYWGVSFPNNEIKLTEHNNHLGKILMRVRKELQE